MKYRLSKLATIVTHSDIRNMSIECDARNGVNLSQGVCDLELPQSLKSAVIDGVNKNFNSYSRYDGIEKLRYAISRKLDKFNNIKADPESEIIVSAGATGAFYATCMAVLDRGDEVIIFEPYYGYHVSTLKAVGAIPVYVKLNKDFSINIDNLKKAITEKTIAIMICTPSNPCGKIFTKEELVVIGDLAVLHDFYIFTDEIYEYFTYEDRGHLSPGSLPKYSERTITISGYSKTFSITGWRIGYVVCNKELAKIIGYMSDLIYVCAPTPLQYATAVAIDEVQSEYFEDLKIQYLQKRDMLCSALFDAKMEPVIPDGAYYILADTSKIHYDGSIKDVAMHVLDKTNVAAVPGSEFFSGNGGDHYLRFCFAKTDQQLDMACKYLKKL